MQRSSAVSSVLGLFATITAIASAQSTSVVSVDSGGIPGFTAGSTHCDISADARWVVFANTARLAPNDLNASGDVYVRDRNTGVTELVSVDGSGFAAGSSAVPFVSDDGRYVAFQSLASTFVAGDANGTADVYVRDRVAGTFTRASLTDLRTEATGDVNVSDMTGDGRFVVMWTTAPLVADDTNADWDLYVRDMAAGTIERASLRDDDGQIAASSFSSGIASGGQISADGRYVVFTTGDAGVVLGDTNSETDAFVRDRQLGTTERVSVTTSGAQSNGNARWASISADGRFVVYTTNATNLIVGDVNGFEDVYLRDRQLAVTELISVSTAGVQTNSNLAAEASVSADGRFVTFTTGASNLVANDTNGTDDLFLRDRVAGTTIALDANVAGTLGNTGAGRGTMSGDASTIVFPSNSINLVDGTLANKQAFLRELNVSAPVVSYCVAKVNSSGCTPQISSSGLPRASGFDDFFVTASALLNDKNGLLFWGTNSASIPFGGGTLCVAPPTVRTPVQNSGSAGFTAPCLGRMTYHFTQAYMQQKGIGAGDTIRAQFWSRDTGFAPPNNIGLTNAVVFTVAP